jgi:hypothetical protein
MTRLPRPRPPAALQAAAALRRGCVARSKPTAWSNEAMLCEGGARPDGKGLRVTLAGPLPASGAGDAAPRQLRFIGIDYKDQAAGTAQALPTNVT